MNGILILTKQKRIKITKNMSQDNLKKLQCSGCKRINYYTTRKRKEGSKKLALNKYCKFCKKHTPHKEMKK